MFNISFGCCRHNVSNIFVQLTEGRSARDQPKQPPAKKRPWFGISLLFFSSFFSSPSSSLAAPPAGIQSDSDPKWSSACYFSASCCHGTVQSDLLYPSLLKKDRASSGRPPWAFSRSPLDFLLAGFLFFFLILDVALLPTWPHHQGHGQVTMVLEESLVSSFSPPVLSSSKSGLPDDTTLSSSQILFPPCAAPFAQALLGWLLHALELIFAMLPHRVPLTVCLASHLLDIFSTMVWLGLAICWRRTSERILSVARCMLCPLFHAVSPSPGLVKLPCALQSTGMR